MKGFVILAAIIAFIGFVLSFSGFEVVDTGHRGVKTTFGEVVSESLPEGIYFYNPFTSSITAMDTRTQLRQDTTLAYTKDVQATNLTYAINFSLSQDSAHIVYREVGIDWETKQLPQIVAASIKTVIGRYEAVELIANRDKATSEIESLIRDNVEGKHINIGKFELTNVDYNDQFEAAVEAKVVAVQKAIEAKNKTVQVQEEANQKVISAQAEAESMQIRSEALSKNQGLVAYEAVQKWNGVLPTMMLGSESVPFISVPKN